MSEIQLPSHWKVVTLGDVARIERGKFAHRPRNDPAFYGGDIPFIQTGDVTASNGYVKTYAQTLNQKGLSVSKIFQKGTIVITIAANIGYTAILEFDSAFPDSLIGITPNNKTIPVDAEYLNYYLWTQQLEMDRQAPRGTQKNINIQFLNPWRVVVPPLPEQKTIAHNLRTIQKAKETRKRELKLERERKAALMQYLFTHGTRNEPRKQTNIGEIPQSWQVVKLENLLREPLKNGHSALATNSQEGIRTLTLTAVTKNNFSIENTKLTQANPDKVKNLWLEAGDILIERANTYEMVGLAALYEGDKNFAIYPDLMIRIRVKEEEIYTKFLVEFFLTPVCRAYFKKNASGTASSMPKIDQGAIRRINIPLPLYQEQREIVEIAKNCDRKIQALEKEITLTDELFHAMLEQLMTGKISTQPLTENYV